MRNKNDGPRRWWDDLPPPVRARVACPAAPADEPREPAPLFTTFELARDLSRLALLVLAIAIGNMLFLLVALALIVG